MSDTTASLRRKIGSAGDLQSVVRSMKALAASSIGQYEQSVRALAAYYRTVELGLSVCLRKGAPAGLTAEGRGRTDEALVGAVVVLGPHFARSPSVVELLTGGRVVGWFALVLGLVFLGQYFLRRHRAGR